MADNLIGSIGASPMDTLAYQDLLLYGGKSGFNSACPSLYNNYMGASSVFNSPYNMGFGYNPNLYNYGNSLLPAAGTAAAGLGAAASTLGNTSQSVSSAQKEAELVKDKQVIYDYALKLNEEGETFAGACTGGLTFAMFENPQNVKHPLNAFNAMRKADKIFDIYGNESIKALWNSNPELMQNAYSQTQAAYRRMEPKWSGVHGWFQKPLNDADKEYVNEIIGKLKTEIAKGSNADKRAIAELTEKLKAARGMDGYLPSAWNWIKNNTWNRIRPNRTVEINGKQITKKKPKAKNLSAKDRVIKKSYIPTNKDGTKGISEIQKGINEAAKGIEFTEQGMKIAGDSLFSAKGMLHVGGNALKEAKPWFVFELAMEVLTKVIPTYMKNGADSCNKQLLQSGAKAAASAAGWGVGRAVGQVAGAAVGRWAGTAIGAAIGSAVPGVGTAIGAVIGFACGCVGSWAATKGVKALMGEEESEKLAKAEQISTEEGQSQLLAMAYEKCQKGEAPKEVQEAMQHVMAA